MGILDSLENNPAFRSALSQLGAAVLPAVLSEVLGNNSQGGLSTIVAKLQQAGFSEQVRSWLRSCPRLWITQARTASCPIPHRPCQGGSRRYHWRVPSSGYRTEKTAG